MKRFFGILLSTLALVGLMPSLAHAQGIPLCANQSKHWVAGGNGTVTDCVTGLMWEQKDSTCATGDPHCVNTHYTWNIGDATGNANGTLYTQFLAALNTDASALGVGTCFANYCDWRIPNIAELQTILLVPFPCSTPPCIVDPVFGPTAASPYWTSTSSKLNPGAAWIVNFNDQGYPVAPFAAVSTLGKDEAFAARAVRGYAFAIPGGW
jgi:hypothetical protein